MINIHTCYMSSFVYILTNKRNGTLYVGVTSDLMNRIKQHKDGFYQGFTKKYRLHTLVYVEIFSEIQAAIYREKQLKQWNRTWKMALIEKNNPHWEDLSISSLCSKRRDSPFPSKRGGGLTPSAAPATLPVCPIRLWELLAMLLFASSFVVFRSTQGMPIFFLARPGLASD